MDKTYWIIVDQDKKLILVGQFFSLPNDAYQFAADHMSGRQNWRVVLIKLYEVL